MSSTTESDSQGHKRKINNEEAMLSSEAPSETTSTTTSSSSTYGKVQTVGKSTNIAFHKPTITRSDIEEKNGHKSAILWFTGLSGSGKSTLANAVHSALFHRKSSSSSSSSSSTSINSYVLDGDNIRHGLCHDLGFTDNDRVENIRRIGEVAKLFLNSGCIVLTAFVSPFRSDRNKARSLVDVDDNSHKGDFIEIYCDADLAVCEERDTKGLYKKARAGIIPNFTGISSTYEIPENPELSVKTGSKSLDECVKQVMDYLEERGILPK